MQSLGIYIRQFPVVVFLSLISIIVFPFALQLIENPVSALLGQAWWIADPRVHHFLGWEDSLHITFLERMEWWRLWTPALLHFSMFHLLFNLIGLWELGQSIEKKYGSFIFIIFSLLIVAVSNLAQYIASSAVFFGGLSGLVYGLIGFFLTRLFLGYSVSMMERSFVASACFFLVFFSLGLTEIIGIYIANIAHWCGLLVGMMGGLILHGVIKERS